MGGRIVLLLWVAVLWGSKNKERHCKLHPFFPHPSILKNIQDAYRVQDRGRMTGTYKQELQNNCSH